MDIRLDAVVRHELGETVLLRTHAMGTVDTGRCVHVNACPITVVHKPVYGCGQRPEEGVMKDHGKIIPKYCDKGTN